MRSVCLLACLTYFSGTRETYIFFTLLFFGLCLLVLVSPLLCAVPSVCLRRLTAHQPWSSRGGGGAWGWGEGNCTDGAAGGSLEAAAGSRLGQQKENSVFQTLLGFGNWFLWSPCLAFRVCQNLTKGDISAQNEVTCWESQASKWSGKWKEVTTLSGKNHWWKCPEKLNFSEKKMETASFLFSQGHCLVCEALGTPACKSWRLGLKLPYFKSGVSKRETENKYFRPYGPCSLCHSYSTLHLSQEAGVDGT